LFKGVKRNERDQEFLSNVKKKTTRKGGEKKKEKKSGEKRKGEDKSGVRETGEGKNNAWTPAPTKAGEKARKKP